MDRQPDLGREPVGKLLLKLAVPTITARLVYMLYNLVDRIYIGHIEGIGTAALTGVGVCLPVIMMISAFAALAAMGGAPRASIEMGKGDHDRAEGIMGACSALLVALSLVLTAVLVIVTGILGALGARYVFDAMKLRDPAIRGFAIGVAAHGIGTARAFQANEQSGAFAALAMGLNGALTALLVPVLAPWIGQLVSR